MICKGYSDWALLVNRGCHNREGNKLKDGIRYLPTEFAGPCQALLNKLNRTTAVDQSGSYLCFARSVSNKPSTSHSPSSSSEASANDAILAMLQKLDNSNKALAQWFDRVKQQSFTPVNHTPPTNDLQREELQSSPQMGSIRHYDMVRDLSLPITENTQEHQ